MEKRRRRAGGGGGAVTLTSSWKDWAEFYGCIKYPSKHAGSDPEAFWLWPIMAITASVQPESGRTQSYMPDPTSRIRFCSVFSKEVLSDCVKRILSGSQPVCKNHPTRFQLMLPSRSGPNRIRHVHWVGLK